MKNYSKYLPLIILSLDAHPKDGFFLEAGFEAGVINATKEPISQNITPTSMDYNGIAYQGVKQNPNVLKSNHSKSPKLEKPSVEKPSAVVSSSSPKHPKNSQESTQTQEPVTPPQAHSVDSQSNLPSSTKSQEQHASPSESHNSKTIIVDSSNPCPYSASPDIACLDSTDASAPKTNVVNGKTLNTTPLPNVNVYGRPQKPIDYPILKHSIETNMLDKITKSEIKNQHPVFEQGKINGIHFSTTNPIATTIKDSQIDMKNFLPYDLHQVDVYVRVNDNGKLKEVHIAHMEDIPKSADITIDKNLFKNLEHFQSQSIPTESFVFKASSSSDEVTKRVLDNVDKITTNIHGVFYQHKDYYGRDPKYYTSFTPETAQLFVNDLLDLAAVFDSKEWADKIMDAGKYFKFQGNISQTQYDNIPAEEVIKQFRAPSNELNIGLVRERTNAYGWSTPRSLDVNPAFLNPDFSPILKEGLVNKPGGLNNNDASRRMFNTLVHEYAHTKGYSHWGNFTKYDPQSFGGVVATVWGDLVLKRALPVLYNNGKVDNGLPDPKVPFTQPQFPSYWNDNDRDGGWMKGDIWQPLEGNATSGPYTNPNANLQGNPYGVNPYQGGSSYGPQGANCHLVSRQYTCHYDDGSVTVSSYALLIQNLNYVLTNISNAHSSYQNSSSNRSHYANSQVGMDMKVGYQKYFNDYVGLAYYGLLKYDYASNSYASLNNIKHMGLGMGIDALFDFITTYSSKKSFVSSFGIFGSVRGIYSHFYVYHQGFNRTNLNVATGLNYRYKHSKYSIGISLPLIKQNLRVQNTSYETILTIGMGHFNVFMNYGWVF
ncbi:porin family protein [Helicobacter cetorum]|uniref:Outer membrane protein n=1 Tax=Helicobacter cetorum (strain ATCC BAA-540 / CCUG 52418 / MIT 99-5656) TaxID=1163745 RepID=I0EQS0_HELCM|nr:hypothetical protein [Helicobacter cetorum]AFI05289.1 hypothetical protein HCD_01285 [Helicobacter cetorum MIT 99-5656]